MAELIIHPIGIYHSKIKYAYEAGRQSDSFHCDGTIELSSAVNPQQSLHFLETFSHIWIIFQFHHNHHWKPMTTPPRGNQKVGTFASRSPYRPNPIGMSAVRLIQVENNHLYVQGADLLDQTPIIDIKPYLTYADSIPEATPGWLNEFQKFEIKISDLAQNQLVFFQQMNEPGLQSFIYHQLEYEPTNQNKKRVKEISQNVFCIAYRTWRIEFLIHDHVIIVQRIRSGYSENEINTEQDPYLDKYLHKLFRIQFPES